jgi:methane/ammonia monooxygenase subunit B
VIRGRNPGQWHVHPGIAIQGTGTLIGPGEWVNVEQGGAPFKMDVMLLNGTTVDLEHFGGGFVWWWSLAGFIVGVIWMIYWTVPKRTVTRLAVTSQISPNDDAPDIGLITPEDHKWMNVLAGITIAMLVGGWAWMAVKYPVRLPQQTDRFAPEVDTPDFHLAQVRPLGSTYDEKTDTLIKDYVGQLQVDPAGAIAPGQTRRLSLIMRNPVFDEERLIPLHDPQQLIAGLLAVEDSGGRREMVTVKSILVPTEFQAQYLP